MASKDPVLRKLQGLRYKYGAAAAEYFVDHPKCEQCGEGRIVTLNIHHLHGKKTDEFCTLCFNCHMLEHSVKPEFTYEHHLELIAIKSKRKEFLSKRDAQIVELKYKGESLRDIAKIMRISHVRVKMILDHARLV